MKKDLLIELGTEELPPTALSRLSQHFSHNIISLLRDANLNLAKYRSFATPRRLAILINDLDDKQDDKEVTKKGPPVKACYDKDGNPGKALLGFARSCNTDIKELSQIETDKGICIAFKSLQKGQTLQQLLPGIIKTSLDKLPIPKRMRWSDLDAQFVRPAHWLVVLYDTKVIDCEILSLKSSDISYGHRFHYPDAIKLNSPQEYEKILEDKGYVIPFYDKRKSLIKKQIQDLSAKIHAFPEIDNDLLDEVTSMVEYPIAIHGNFDEKFLQIPAEALISSMKKHQKYFHCYQDKEKTQLMPTFITISNIDSPEPEKIQQGNERVIRPRLSDANFFWNNDLKSPLSDLTERLKNIIFQEKLGSLYDKVQRIVKLSSYIADHLSLNQSDTKQAALLCKSDLVSEMVGEFPELQGIMGKYYALHQNYSEEIAIALEEYYLPRFSGDRISNNSLAQCIGIADRIDTLYGIFSIGLQPTGDKDPFALRRAALAIIRIMVENNSKLDLYDLLSFSSDLYKEKLNINSDISTIINFIIERFKGYLLDQNYNQSYFESVKALNITELVDFIDRMQAVKSFSELEEADSLSSANKRIHNILKKDEIKNISMHIDTSLFTSSEENELYNHYRLIDSELEQLYLKSDYSAYLHKLVSFSPLINNFFDKVMVFDEDIALRNNRLALLKIINNRFTQVADISCLIG